MSELERRQSSVWYGYEDSDARIYQRLGLHYVHMFSQDLGEQIIPSGVDRDWGLELTVETADPQVEKILARGFDISRGSGYARRLAYPLSEFTRLTTAELCDHPEAVYEIAYLYLPGRERPVGFELAHLPFYQLRRSFGRRYQVVPPDVAEHRKCLQRIRLPKENLAIFQLPQPLRRRLARAVSTYERLSILRPSSLYRAGITEQTPYDFSTHQRSLWLALMEAARLTGWDARGEYQNHVLTSYWLKQQIEFRRLGMRVREALMTQIYDVVRRVGEKIGFTAQVRLSGFYSDEELDEIHQLIDEGQTSFTTIADKLSMYPHRKTDSSIKDGIGEFEPQFDEGDENSVRQPVSD
ncbi:MAG: hypothetical protein Q8M02_11845 [Candidatus Didemnitutus sp.]|nr:hypothetical protein [Candidatus Didemnitutus sp.]